MAMWKRQYYTLHASLPALPYFDKAKVLPISRERLEARMGMLAPEDAETMEKVKPVGSHAACSTVFSTLPSSFLTGC